MFGLAWVAFMVGHGHGPHLDTMIRARRSAGIGARAAEVTARTVSVPHEHGRCVHGQDMNGLPFVLLVDSEPWR
jgi:hypothetical protein